jgi:hypothetical protein
MTEAAEDIPSTVHITRVETGETRSMPFDFDGDFIWSEGNFSCDCNRNLFFERECLGAKDDEGRADDRECGQEAFLVRITSNATGEVLYEDDHE